MQLGIAGFVPVEPRCRCCGLRTLLSAPKPQLTYSFCYWLLFFPSFLFSGCQGFVRLNLQIVGETVCRFKFKKSLFSNCRNEKRNCQGPMNCQVTKSVEQF